MGVTVKKLLDFYSFVCLFDCPHCRDLRVEVVLVLNFTTSSNFVIVRCSWNIFITGKVFNWIFQYRFQFCDLTF